MPRTKDELDGDIDIQNLRLVGISSAGVDDDDDDIIALRDLGLILAEDTLEREDDIAALRLLGRQLSH